MNRKTRNIVLALIGSAGLMTCCVSSCVQHQDEVVKDPEGNVVRDDKGQPVHRRHYVFRPWFSRGYWSPGYSYGYSSPAYAPTGPGSPATRPAGGTSGSGGSRPSGTATSRGGFGGTGHATAGG